MIIICGQCQTKFRIHAGQIKDTGTLVRCSNCQAVFTVFAPSTAEFSEETDPSGPSPPRDNDLDRELESYFRGSDADGEEGPESPPRAAARLTAIQPKRAENNPINLIKLNGDSFVVPETATAMRPTDDDPSRGGGRPAGLGLDADPLGQAAGGGPSFGAVPDGSYADPGAGAPLAPLRQPSSGLKKNQKILILAASVAAALLVVAGLFLFSGPDAAPVPQVVAATVPGAVAAGAGDQAPADGQAAAAENPLQDDGIIKIAFLTAQNKHLYIENATEGTLLVLTGRVQNNTDRPISKLRIKGMLADSQENVIAERQVIAGNFLTEEELKVMPIGDIMQRLSLNVGPNSNQVIAPSETIPYMIVFHKFPSNMAMYLLEPMSYSDDSEAPPSR
jgi:predicted Zn finger-like uncharacterized protein